MLKALHGWYQWKAEIESNLEVPSIQSTFWVMWRKFNIKLSHSVFTWPLFVRKCLFFQTNQPFTQTCDICTHIVSYMVWKLLKRSTFLRTQLHSYDANLKSYEFIPHAGISNMWDLTPHHRALIVLSLPKRIYNHFVQSIIFQTPERKKSDGIIKTVLLNIYPQHEPLVTFSLLVVWKIAHIFSLYPKKLSRAFFVCLRPFWIW